MGQGSMRQGLVVGQSPCSHKLPGQCNGVRFSVSENLETRDVRHYFALKLFYLRIFSFCSPIWGVQIHPSLCSAKMSSSIPPLLKISKGAKGMVGFLYPYHQLCSYCSGLPGSFPGFWWPHSESYTLGIVSEACFKVNDILGNGGTVSEPLWGRILVVSWQFSL